MTNQEMIIEHLEANEIEFNYNGKNLMTFQQWKREGYSVSKGQTAFTKVDLWTCKEVKKKDEKGKETDEKEKKFYLKTSALFTIDQVEKIQKKTKKKSKKVA